MQAKHGILIRNCEVNSITTRSTQHGPTFEYTKPVGAVCHVCKFVADRIVSVCVCMVHGTTNQWKVLSNCAKEEKNWILQFIVKSLKIKCVLCAVRIARSRQSDQFFFFSFQLIPASFGEAETEVGIYEFAVGSGGSAGGGGGKRFRVERCALYHVMFSRFLLLLLLHEYMSSMWTTNECKEWKTSWLLKRITE